MSDRGHAAAELGLAVGLLLIPVAMAVLAFGPWSERRVFAEAAAAEAARSAVIDLSTASGSAVLAEMTINHGLESDVVRLGWCGRSPTEMPNPAADCSFERGTEVTAEVLVWTPLVNTPWGAVGGVWVRAVHSEPIDLYRSLG
jgi:hypothetical protein